MEKADIIGFKYEPEIADYESINSDSCEEVEEDNIELFKNDQARENLQSWCFCGNCKFMSSQNECICCVGIDEIKYIKQAVIQR